MPESSCADCATTRPAVSGDLPTVRGVPLRVLDVTTHENAPPPPDWRPEPRAQVIEFPKPDLSIPPNIELGSE